MSDKKKILLVGDSNMDLTLNIARLPDKGEFLKDDGGVSYAPGGSSAGAAIAFAKFGQDSMFVTRLGADLYGQKLYSYYKENGINTGYIKVDRDFATGFSVRIREADGTSRVINFPGANEHLTQDVVSEAFQTRPDAFYTGFEAPFLSVVKYAKIAASRGIPIFVNASPADSNYSLDAMPPLEIFMLGEAETLRYTGINPVGSQESLRALFSLWRKVKAKYIVINQGIRGAMIYDGKRCEIINPFIYEKAQDDSAVRESFAAALTAEYISCGDIKLAVKFAVAAAAVTASRFGGSTSIPTDSELRALINKNQ